MDIYPRQDDSTDPPSSNHRREPPAGPGLLARFPFIKPAMEAQPAEIMTEDSPHHGSNVSSSSSLSVQTKTRRRRGSLRKVALLGRGAQRDKRDGKVLAIDTAQATAYEPVPGNSGTVTSAEDHNALGLKVADGRAMTQQDESSPQQFLPSTRVVSPERDAETHASQDTSTTDEEDILHMSHGTTAPRPTLSVSSSGSDSYFAARGTSPRPGPFQQAKSPLSYSGISTTTIPTSDTDWDYAETEWWGWVVLTVTWLVFVVGMGSCLDIWSWAWDVGKTPYAPPELEDDPTLPIVGYYPALIILTCVMAWVWVVVAWVGMKYFRHAKISGD